jgi:hypothetical protein
MKSRVSFSRAVVIATALAAGVSTAYSAPGGMPPPIPCAFTGVIPKCISLVGNNGGATDPHGSFTIIVRDCNNVPINSSVVVVDFSGCSGVWLCQTQPGLFVNCTLQCVYGYTNGVGAITMSIAGHGSDYLGNSPPYNAPGCARIYADGLLVGSVDVSIYDHGGSGLNGADFGALLGDFFGSQPLRSDYDCSGTVTGADLAQWLTVFFGSASTSNCPSAGAQCPAVP